MTPAPLIEDIQSVVAARYGLTVRDIRARYRHKLLAYPRQTAMYLARQMTNRSLTEIGRVFHRHHTTVLHDIRRAEERIANDPAEARAVREMERRIRHVVEDRIWSARLAA